MSQEENFNNNSECINSLENADKDLIFRQYQLYCQMKETYVARNFNTNKFYLCVIIAILLIMFFTRDVMFKYNISANLIMSILGMAVSFFWWANTDSYNIMIKVKLKHVIDELEKYLPMTIHKTEMIKYGEYKKQNKLIIFSDVQKAVAIAMLLIFFCLFLIEIVYPFVTLIIAPIQG